MKRSGLEERVTRSAMTSWNAFLSSRSRGMQKGGLSGTMKEDAARTFLCSQTVFCETPAGRGAFESSSTHYLFLTSEICAVNDCTRCSWYIVTCDQP